MPGRRTSPDDVLSADRPWAHAVDEAARSAPAIGRASLGWALVFALGGGCASGSGDIATLRDLGFDAGETIVDAGVDLGTDAGTTSMDAGVDLGTDAGSGTATCTPDFPNSCAAANLYTVTVGPNQTVDVQGVIDATGDDYFTVAFTGAAGATVPYHPKIAMVINPSNAYSFEVLSACGTVELGCGSGLTTFEAVYPGATHGCDSSNCSDLDGRNTSYVVHVSRASLPLSCFTYMIRVTNAP